MKMNLDNERDGVVAQKFDNHVRSGGSGAVWPGPLGHVSSRQATHEADSRTPG